MDRTTVAALVVACAVGFAGGTATAMVRTRDAPPAASRPSPTAAPTPARPAPVLYAGEGVIRDGDRTVRLALSVDTPDRLVRTATGYLVAVDASPREPGTRVYAVSPDGRATPVADVLGRWDLDGAGRRVVGTALDDGRVTVWDLRGREVAATTGVPGLADPVWSGGTVVASALGTGEDADRLVRWDPASGSGFRATRFAGAGGLTSSPDGALLAGATGPEGFSLRDGSGACLRVSSAPGRTGPDGDAVSWLTCDYRANGGRTTLFSPRGTRVLAVPAETDGFGPGLFVTFDAQRGPRGDLREIDAPDWTLDAAWLDERTVVLLGASDPGAFADAVIRRCDLDGACTEVARRERGDLVLGEQG